MVFVLCTICDEYRFLKMLWFRHFQSLRVSTEFTALHKIIDWLYQNRVFLDRVYRYDIIGFFQLCDNGKFADWSLAIGMLSSCHMLASPIASAAKLQDWPEWLWYVLEYILRTVDVISVYHQSGTTQCIAVAVYVTILSRILLRCIFSSVKCLRGG